MIIDGNQIAKDIYGQVAKEVAARKRTPVLAALTCAPNFETQKYLQLKTKKAREVGIELRILELPKTVTTADVISQIAAIVSTVDGVVVQLPFPAHIDREAILRAVPVEKDPDGFSYGVAKGACLPPVVGAIAEIAQRHAISFSDKQVVVLGQGRLVGQPVTHFLQAMGASVTVVTEHDAHKAEKIKAAEIIVTGIGKPHAISVDDIAAGVLVFDAGTSEDGGIVVGDVQPQVAFKAGLFTPVPGGIGPITIAVLLRNLLDLTRQ
jgi:methylenetetrahydrofolate dehydrogenase (NADP+) / methenyltetrahydrofolate cyclohydrolase